MIRVGGSYDPHDRLFVDVKTTTGHRKVPIAAVLRDHLLAHELDSGRGVRLVFGRAADLPFLGNNVRSRSVTAWKNATVARVAELEPQIGREATVAERAAVTLSPIGFHEARHTFASLMIAAGVNVKAISTYMGTRR